MKILVVEDEIYSRISLVKLIRDHPGFGSIEVVEAANGKSGLEVFRREKPEMVLTDIKMPIMDGIELMKAVLLENPAACVIIISGYAEFKLAQEALNIGAKGYLLKPVKDDELYECIDRQIKESCVSEQRKLDFLRWNENERLSDFIYLRIFSRNEKPVTDSEAAFAGRFPSYCFTTASFSHGRPPDLLAVFQELNTLCGKYNVDFCAVGMAHNVIGILLGNVAGAGSVLQRYAGESGICLGVSNVFSGAAELPAAYDQALTALRFKIFGRGPLIRYSSLVEGALPGQANPRLDLIRYFIQIGNEAQMLKRMREVHADLLRRTDEPLGAYQTLAGRLQSVVRETDRRLDSNRTCSPGVSFDVIDYSSTGEFLGAMELAAKNACRAVAEMGGKPAVDVAAMVVEYIRQNYSQDISLKHLAEKVFYLNHTYLSHLISEKLGKSYSQYLKEVRMVKARELLEDRRLAITEIASLCGYNNTSLFIQTFKKETGVTPKQYQNSLYRNQL